MPAQEKNSPPNLPGLKYLESLGEGGYAEVFLYEQANTRMKVAVKVLFKENLSDHDREQFAAEARTMAELADHPNIVQVFGADVTADGRPYLTMKYYPPPNLAIRARSERLSVEEVLRIGIRISAAVETAHRAGILHRDIKPANILTSRAGEPGLTDFGIATRSTGVHDEESGGVSVPWAAPEIVFATAPGDETSDVYSIGATLWHLLVGHSPFEDPRGDSSRAAHMRRIREKPPPRTGREDVPASLERLLAQAMDKNPADRPQSALALGRSLRTIEAEQGFGSTALVLLEDERAAVKPAQTDPPGPPDSDPNGYYTHRRLNISEPDSLPPSLGHAAAHSSVEPPTVRTVVVATGAQTAVYPPATPASGGGRVRHGIPVARDLTETVRGPKVASPAAAPIAPKAEPPLKEPVPSAVRPASHRYLKLVIAAIVSIGVFVGVAALLTPKSGTPPATPDPPTAPALLSALQGPQVTGTRIDATHVQFSWTEGDPQPGDRYYWEEPGGTFQVASSSSVTVTTLPSQAACITVEVARGSAFADSSPACAGGP